MFIVRVIPISRSIFKDELTFFSRDHIPDGALVQVPVRGKTISALTLSARDVREEKNEIRKADYVLKKIEPGKYPQIFSPAFIEAVRDTALWHGGHESDILSLLTSQPILNSASKLHIHQKTATPELEAGPRPEVLIFQASKEERVRTYRNLAREGIARGKSLMIIAPTIIEAETLKVELERGIEERVILLTSEVAKKKLLETWNRALAETSPLIVVGTSFTLSLPIENLDTVIVERESARAYRGIMRPRADIRRAAEFFAQRKGARCILADFPLRTETRYRLDIGEAEELTRAQARATGAETLRILDARLKDGSKELAGTKGKKRTFRALSEETIASIRQETGRGGRVAVFAARKGIAPLTVCNDCGTPVTDIETGTPMVLHKSSEGNIFLSHRSGAVIPAGTPCSNCGSWNLVSLGIGIEKVFEELKVAFPDSSVHLFTKDSAPTHKAAKKIADQFFSEGRSIAVGTERMLPYLSMPADMTVVASVDSLLSLSAWRSHEHTLSTLFFLREKALNACIVETRKPEHPVMKAFASGNPLDFYRPEIEERKLYGYPPFSVFVGLSWHGSRNAEEKSRKLVESSFGDIDMVGPLPAVSEGKNEWSGRAVIRILKKSWPEESVAARLRSLPPDISVIIDPDEIA